MNNSTFLSFVDQIMADKKSGRKLPPVEAWDPPLSGKMDLKIARDGRWYHEGTAFQRQSLVKLLSSILRREGDDYFLLSPVEKWQIQVDDAPLLVIDCDVVNRDGQQALIFSTATDDVVVADRDHPIRVIADHRTGEPSPYVLVRGGLEARINRSVYYRLVEKADERLIEGATRYVVSSMGEDFILG